MSTVEPNTATASAAAVTVSSSRDAQGGHNVLGTVLTVKSASAQTDGTYSVLVCDVPPGAGTPLHTHEQPESFFIISGDFEFGRVGPSGPQAVRVNAGDIVTVPSRAPHSFNNVGSTPGQLLVICQGSLQRFFEDADVGPATAGPPTNPQIAHVMRAMTAHGMQLLGPHPGHA